MSSKFKILMAVMAIMMMLPGADVRADVSLFLLHHSTGRHFIDDGNVRQIIADLEVNQGTHFNFWDHDYTYIGLMNPEGQLMGYHYGNDLAETDPVDLHHLWTTANAARDSILNNHQIIAFKSCYPACHIDSDGLLEQYKTWYNEMADVFDQYPEKVFVVLSPPPLHRLRTNVGESDRARAFANWLGGEFLADHTNIQFFNLFDYLAQADDGSDTRNMLRYEFERSHDTDDSHPNEEGNIQAGQAFAEALVGAVAVPVRKTTMSGLRSMYR